MQWPVANGLTSGSYLECALMLREEQGRRIDVLAPVIAKDSGPLLLISKRSNDPPACAYLTDKPQFLHGCMGQGLPGAGP